MYVRFNNQDHFAMIDFSYHPKSDIEITALVINPKPKVMVDLMSEEYEWLISAEDLKTFKAAAKEHLRIPCETNSDDTCSGFSITAMATIKTLSIKKYIGDYLMALNKSLNKCPDEIYLHQNDINHLLKEAAKVNDKKQSVVYFDGFEVVGIGIKYKGIKVRVAP